MPIGSTAGLIMGGLSAAGSLAGGLMGQGGANAAAGGINSAASNAAFRAQQQAKENRSDLSPWTSTGTNAIGQIGALLGYGSLWNRGGDGATYQWESDPNAQGNAQNQLRSYLNMFPQGPEWSRTFQADPGYAFRQREGQKALERGAAARGKTLSGEQFKALSDFNSGLASQEYGNWWNRALQGFGADYGRYRDAIGDIYGAAGMGQGATNSLAGYNTNLSSVGGNALLRGAEGAGQATMAGSNALASGVGSGINNLMSSAYLFGRGGGRGSGYSGPNSGWTY